MDTIPIELLVQILSQVQVVNLITIATTCKLFLHAVKHPYFWIQINERFNIQSEIQPPYHVPLLTHLRNSWDLDYKSSFITVSTDHLTAQRLTRLGHNPSILAKSPLEVGSNRSVSIKICETGNWLSLGLSTRDFKDKSGVIGEQNCPCVGLFWDWDTSKAWLSSRMASNNCSSPTIPVNQNDEFINLTENIACIKGDKVRIVREENMLHFYLNTKLVYTLQNFSSQYVWYPCVLLSAFSSVELV